MTEENRIPALFLGHGNPMFTLSDNVYSRAWATLGKRLPRPKAVLCISAHWYVPATLLTGDRHPRTIHDFGGFPQSLFDIQYPAPGDPLLAKQVADLLAPEEVSLDDQWGLDHGTWTVLRHLFPEADVPIVQLSLNRTNDAAWHFDLARRLRPLREQGVMVVGSGNLVHNLRAYAWKQPSAAPHDWATRFEAMARERIEALDFEPLVNYLEQGPDALLAVPTPDHYLPLLYVLAQHLPGERITFPVEGFDGGSMSMLAVQMG